jgi:hypothetical protein
VTLLSDEVRSYIGLAGSTETACDVAERGAVRRFLQAYMDESGHFGDVSRKPARFGDPVAPPLYPMTAFRRPLGTPDPLSEGARDPDFDGITGSTAQGLPSLPLPPGTGLLNGGTEIEIFRYARIGEAFVAVSRYASITEKATSKGPALFVVIETEYRTHDGDLLLRVRKTQIRR